MKTLNSEKRLCPICLSEHDVRSVMVTDSAEFKGVSVEYPAEYFYCDKTGETYADERQLSMNDISMKDAYRGKMGLLTGKQIAGIRAKYGISQGDLCVLLGWGGKTITRYEGHQVQDAAHDTILRKLDADPEWFLQLLRTARDSFSKSAYDKYMELGTALFEGNRDSYLKSVIMSHYARFNAPEMTGGKSLSLDVVADMIRYLANSGVKDLFMTKLVKLLWYADYLSYKRLGHAISGMVYRAFPMGAVPEAYRLILNLSTINSKEVDIGLGTGYEFMPSDDKEYPHLSQSDMEMLDAVVRRFRNSSKYQVVQSMHREDAFIKTPSRDIITFDYAQTLSLS